MKGDISYNEATEDLAVSIDRDDLKEIRHLALTNISGEIVQISDLVENSIVDLSDEFRELVKYSQQQVQDMSTACDLLQGGKSDIDRENQDIIHEMLMASAEISTCFNQNVNRMIYTMQFQDRARQLMLAISASLNILIKLSQTVESGENCENVTKKTVISERNRNILSQLIKEGDHKELDQNYILKMLLGSMDTNSEAENNNKADLADIEFF